MEDRFETFTVLIARISRSIRRLKAEEMERLGLKGPHVSCLYYLSLYDELTAAELCERCDEDKAAISRSIDYLEKNGYLTCGSGGARLGCGGARGHVPGARDDREPSRTDLR